MTFAIDKWLTHGMRKLIAVTVLLINMLALYASGSAA